SAFVTAEQEGLVLPVIQFWDEHRAAARQAELVLVELGSAGGKRIARVEIIIAEELPQGGMEFVGAGLSDHVHLHGITTVFGAEVRSGDRELRDGIRIGN